ncbi:MAG: hypothetical protein COA90_09900 [Gammaproteobacteria bacterium]|nr:MAG: hypothetical protein COA90_09900 [Gammaproteobacteria bacterium]
MVASLLFQTGQTIATRYDIKGFISDNGMGGIYQAQDKETDEAVLINTLSSSDDIARNNFLIEANASRLLSHPHIVPVLDVHSEGELCFLSTKNPKGDTLRHVMDSRNKQDRPFTESELSGIFASLISALNYAQEQGEVLHRDIKPENIYLTRLGEYQLTGFGIARAMNARQRTVSGVALGTAYYIAPEILKGTEKIDSRADQYSLAVLAYELLTGRVPTGRFKPLDELNTAVSRSFSDAVKKSLSVKPEDRFQSHKQFLMALQGKSTSKLSQFATYSIVIGLVIFAGSYLTNQQQAVPPILADQEQLEKELQVSMIEVAQLTELKRVVDELNSKREQLKLLLTTSKPSELNQIEHWLTSSNNYVVSEATLAPLNTRRDKAMLTLEQHPNDTEALQIVEDLTSRYKIVLVEFTAAKELYEIEKQLSTVQQKWTGYSLGKPTELKQAGIQLIEVNKQLESGQVTKSLAGYEQVINLYHTANKQAENIASSRNKSLAAQQKWLNREIDQDLLATKLQQQAGTHQSQAENNQQQGKLDAAVTQWQASEQTWLAAYQSVVQQADEIAEVNEEKLIEQQKQQALAIKQLEEQLLAEEEAKKAQFIENDLAENLAVVELEAESVAIDLKQWVGELISIPSGTFTMGCVTSTSCDESEYPVHKVSINTFKMGQTEVTQAQYQRCVDDNACSSVSEQLKAMENHPVMNVSWHDAQQYIEWLNNKTAKAFRLATESEWEYAARGGSTSAYSWGDTISSNQANCYKKHCGDNYPQTAPVKSFPANGYGLYDMHGNVWEWTKDCWHGDYSNAASGGQAWLAGNCGKRVRRGGAWSSGADYLRSATRSWYASSTRNKSNGFRLVLPY